MAKDDSESSAENLSDQKDLTDPSADENLPDEDEDLKETISSIQDLHVAGKQNKTSRKPGLASLSSVAYNLCDLVTASSAKLPRRKRKYFPGHDIDDHIDDDDDDGIGKGIKIPSSKKMKLSISTSSSNSLATDDHVGSTTPPAALLSASANQDSDQVDHHQGTDQDHNQESPSPKSIPSSQSKESKPSSDDLSKKKKPSSDEEKGLELD